MQQLPQKSFYKLSEVCQYTDTQPYVLRFWEGEFPQLNPSKSASGQRLYRKKDIAVVCRIKELLYDESNSLEAARQKLAEEMARGRRPKVSPPAARPSEPADEGQAPANASGRSAEPRRTPIDAENSAPEVEMVPRQRYEDAVDEIDHLRLAVKDAEKAARRAETVAEEAREAAERERARAERAIGHLERVLDILS